MAKRQPNTTFRSRENISRINVVGTSGSGKTTFGRQLAQILGCKFIEMDYLSWQPDWQPTPEKEFLAALEKELSGDAWVIDGNYTRTIPIKWPRTQMVIWLDYSFLTVLFQVVKRSVLRAFKNEELWHGNRESFRRMFSRKSIIWWMITTHKKNRLKYEKLMRDTRFAHILFVRLKSRRESESFLKTVQDKQHIAFSDFQQHLSSPA